MLRWGLACGTITLDKIAGDVNIADLMTKPITGLRFFILRARVLGLPIHGPYPGLIHDVRVPQAYLISQI